MPKGFLNGFTGATIGLGCLLVVSWVVLWGVGAVGGPQWQMPLKLLTSGGSLIFMGFLVRFFLAQSSARSS